MGQGAAEKRDGAKEGKFPIRQEINSPGLKPSGTPAHPSSLEELRTTELNTAEEPVSNPDIPVEF